MGILIIRLENFLERFSDFVNSTYKDYFHNLAWFRWIPDNPRYIVIHSE